MKVNNVLSFTISSSLKGEQSHVTDSDEARMCLQYTSHGRLRQLTPLCDPVCLSLSLSHTHTHTHTHMLRKTPHLNSQ